MELSDILRATTAPRLTSISAGVGATGVDGAWWPRSLDLDEEVAALVDALPEELGRVERVEYSPAHWATPEHEVATGIGLVTVAGALRQDAHLLVLTMSSGRVLCLLVLPVTIAEAQARLLMHQHEPPASRPDRSQEDATHAGSAAAPPPEQQDRWVDYGDDFFWDRIPAPRTMSW
jgi:hypothetical protein